MYSLYRNKYKTGSSRYHGYDYSSPGKYFITIGTKNKIPYSEKLKMGDGFIGNRENCG
jgi:hypothetical protein